MLSPKNHIRGKCMRGATKAGVGQTAVQPNKKAGVEAGLFGIRFVESEDQYLAMPALPKR